MPLKRSGKRPRLASPPVSRPIPELLALLDRGDSPAAQRDAALELATVPEATPALLVALDQVAHAAVREAVIAALISIGTEDAVRGLARQLASEDVALRNAAIEALQQMPNAGGHIVNLLSDKDPDVRIFAINVSEVLPHRSVRDWLAQVLAKDADLNVGLAAVEALAQIGGPEDVATLRDFAARFPDEAFVRFAVDLACRRVAAGQRA